LSGYSAVSYELESCQSVKKTKKYTFVKHIILLHSLLRKVMVPWYADMYFSLISWCSGRYGPPHSQLHYNMHDTLQNDAYTVHLATHHEQHLRHIFLTSLQFLYFHVRYNICTTMILSPQSCFLKALRQWKLDIICTLLCHKKKYLFIIDLFHNFSIMWLHDIRWYSRILVSNEVEGMRKPQKGSGRTVGLWANILYERRSSKIQRKIAIHCT
jgi:hypothetical protein